MAIFSRLLPSLVSISIFCLLFCFVFSCCVWLCQPGSASGVRISRPAAVDSVESCCSGEADAPGPEQAIVLPGSALAHFNHWRKRYINPVFCPVMLCHGSCGNFDDACTIESEVVLLNPASGCAGSCK
jgi:hypothetical protein